jgi:hypothetical protein
MEDLKMFYNAIQSKEEDEPKPVHPGELWSSDSEEEEIQSESVANPRG